jgi:hypothetical protein
MQPPVLENGDEIGKIEDQLVIPSWGSPCDDSSDIPQIFPRIGDQYQAEVPPFNPHKDRYKQDRSGNMSIEEKEDEDNEELFAEGLPVPIMQIPFFSPKLDLIESEMDCGNEPSSESAFGVKATIFSVEKLESKPCQLDLLEFPDKRCIHEHNFSDIIHLPQDYEDSSMADMKGEISGKKVEQESICIDSVNAANSVPDAVSSGRGRRRRRGKGGWKKVKKAKVELSKPSKQRTEPNVHNEHTKQDLTSRQFIIVPGKPSEPWTETEEEVFLLALYIFGKNFIPVRSFMETKEMKDILSYYYGKFYGTESYYRWAESRKIRSRKCFQGQRIFSGWRQQELSIRLLPHVPEHLKDKLPDALKSFNEGRISIEEFVTELKTLAGLNMLVQAVGIGKGNHDLTAALMDPMKTNQVVSAREIPMGRACSSLSTDEIVKFLTGDYRLSKARANDLFWEAVWPRLLARGWHSQQPEDLATSGSRHSLVFLIPGVQKFSRTLVKGVHYFDSVSEVLNRIASEPRLLDPPQLEMGDIRGSKVKPECHWTGEILEEQNDRLRDPPCYLRPRYCPRNLDSYAFTVVDTSLVSQGEEPARFWESRTLPAEDLSSCLQSDSVETEDLNSELLLSKAAKTCESLVVEDPLNTYPAETDPVAISNKSFGGDDRICTLSTSHRSDLPSLQSEESNYFSSNLMFQIGSSPPISKEGTVNSLVGGRGATRELNQQECNYGPSDPNSPVVNDAVSCRETPVSCNSLSSLSKERTLSLYNNDESETRDSGLIESSDTKEHGVVALVPSLIVKSNDKEETPVSVVGTSTAEKSPCIAPLSQADQENNEKDLSTLISRNWLSFNRTSNNALYSRLCKFKPQAVHALASSQDNLESVMLNSFPVSSTAYLEAPKSNENFISEHDPACPQETTTYYGHVQSLSSDPCLDTRKSQQNRQSEQDFRHCQEQPNDSKPAQSLGNNTLVEGANSEIFSFEKNPRHPQGQLSGSEQTQSAAPTSDEGHPHETQENNVQEFRAEGRRQSTRTRPLTVKALEAFASGFYTVKRRKGGKSTVNPDNSHTKSISRQFTDEPTCLLNGFSSDNNDITIVDTSMESVEGEGMNDSQFGHKSRCSYKKRRRTHAVMKVPKGGLYSESLGLEDREDVVTGILVSEVGN